MSIKAWCSSGWPHPNVCANQTVFIGDLNVDCLEHIFKHLAINELINMAHTSKLMRMVACLIIERTIKNKSLFLELSITTKYCKQNADQLQIEYEEDVLIIRYVKTGLRFLRCFGYSILKMRLTFPYTDDRLMINFKYPNRVKALLYEYVFKYCADSLNELELHIIDWTVLTNLWNINWKKNWKPFANVEKVYFKECWLDNKLISLNELFPKLSCLDFINLREQHNHTGSYLTNWRCIVEPFSNLQHLSVEIESHKFHYGGFKEEDVIAALKLNTKLRSLSLIWSSLYDSMDIFPDFFSLLCEHGKCLESLEMDFGKYVRLLHDEDEIFHFKRLRYLYLHFNTSESTPFPSKIPFKSDALECINLRIRYLSEQILDFIKKNPEISNIFYTKFTRNIRDYYVDSTLLDPFNFSCRKVKLSANDAISLMNKCKPLEKFVFEIPSYSEFMRFKQLMENRWITTYEYNKLFASYFVNCNKLE